MTLCAFCGEEVPLSGRVARTEECPRCQRDLHCCYQCRFYDPAFHHECRESQAEYVSDKEKANFCDSFVFDPQVRVPKTSTEESLKNLETLFKKK